MLPAAGDAASWGAGGLGADVPATEQPWPWLGEGGGSVSPVSHWAVDLEDGPPLTSPPPAPGSLERGGLSGPLRDWDSSRRYRWRLPDLSLPFLTVAAGCWFRDPAPWHTPGPLSASPASSLRWQRSRVGLGKAEAQFWTISFRSHRGTVRTLREPDVLVNAVHDCLVLSMTL